MSNEIDRLSDPGLPEHQHRTTDIDPVAEIEPLPIPNLTPKLYIVLNT